MKKRFTLMMMVLCTLMCIPLKMMAEIVTIHFVDEDGWGDYAAYVYDSTKPDDGSNWLTGKWPGQVATATDIKEINGNKKVVTWKIDTKDCPSGKALVLFNNNKYNNVEKKYPSSVGWVVKDGLYYYKNGTTSTTPPSGGSTGGGTEGGGDGSTTEVWNTVTTNRLKEKPRVYTQGFYLAGSFFTFSGDKDNRDKVTYDDAVFKFQQQKYDSKDYDLYKVEIPASLTAHAQVMSVNEFGKPVKVYGPGSKYGISFTCPKTDMTTDQLELKGSEKFEEGSNYWNLVSRNESSTEYSDGMYEVYITVDKTTGEPAQWWFKHIGTNRVAYFISDAPDATAMPLYDTYKGMDSEEAKQFSNKFFATVNLAANRSYYVISNYVRDKQYTDWAKSYGAFNPNLHAISCPTTKKLFLLGNGGVECTGNRPQNEVLPNEAPVKINKDNLGVQIFEYNPSKGDDNRCKDADHYGFIGEIQLRNDRAVLTSVSMVGDAIPGTVKADGTWDYKSKAADMIYDETEQCYKVTLVTTVAEGANKFRFVGNRNPGINWHEDSNTDASMMAKTPYNGGGAGHAATSYDPNKVNYVQPNAEGVSANSEAEWNIIWNRPAGRWTVRLYFYTYSDGNNPVTDYYYTISESKELELRDFDDVVYKSLDNKRNILLRGDYKFFRSWSSAKAWKISKDVDIFVVDGMTENEGSVKFSLKKITADPNKVDNVIPSNTGVILATKKTADQIEGGAVLRERASLTSYNTMVLPMEEYNPTTASTSTDYSGENHLIKMVEAGVVPTYNKTTDEYNYLFGFYHAITGTGNADNPATGKKYNADEYLLGFWISNGNGAFYSNSAYLPIPAAKAENMGLGVSYKDFDTTTHAKKVPALFFDFANIGGTTGIDEVVNTTGKNNDGKYYTLSGQQVEKPTTSGVYIHNGKKFVVR